MFVGGRRRTKTKADAFARRMLGARAPGGDAAASLLGEGGCGGGAGVAKEGKSTASSRLTALAVSVDSLFVGEGMRTCRGVIGSASGTGEGKSGQAVVSSAMAHRQNSRRWGARQRFPRAAKQRSAVSVLKSVGWPSSSRRSFRDSEGAIQGDCRGARVRTVPKARRKWITARLAGARSGSDHRALGCSRAC